MTPWWQSTISYLHTAAAYLRAHWWWPATIGASILGYSTFRLNLRNERKAKEEISKLQRDLKEKRLTTVDELTLEEIRTFASKNPTPQELRRFLKMHRSALEREGKPHPVPPETADAVAVALERVKVETVLERIADAASPAVLFVVFLQEVLSHLFRFVHRRSDFEQFWIEVLSLVVSVMLWIVIFEFIRKPR